MIKPDIQLLPASLDELFQLQSWFRSAEQTHTWAGDNFPYPAHFSRFLQHLCPHGTASYVLLQKPEQIMLGFGQLCDRFGKHHLARLVINPQLRGQGLAKRLICELMLAGLAKQQRDFSLYVHRHNKIALNCYQRLGFQFAEQPEAENKQLFFMVISFADTIHLCRQYLSSLNIDPDNVAGH